MSARTRTRETLADLAAAGRFARELPVFLRQRMSPARAKVVLDERLEQRADDFLALADAAVFGGKETPYRRLLARAGCERGDLVRLVRREGLEPALLALAREGVYLTVDELKGRRPVVRGGVTLEVSPESVWNPLARPHFLHYRSGSSDGRARRAPSPVDFAHLRDRLVNLCLALHARGGIGWSHAYWDVPGSMVMVYLLENGAFDRPAVRWFTQVDLSAEGLHPRYRWSGRLMRAECALFGVRLPSPQYAPLDDPAPILAWLGRTLRDRRTPHLKTYASSAVLLAQAAEAAGLDLTGAQFTVSGEPATPARLAAIRRSGATAVQRAGSSELGPIGYGCLAPDTAGDLHHFADMHALIQPGAAECPAGLRPQSLLFTSLRRASRTVFLNVSIGDQAERLDSDCGCPLFGLGWRTRLRGLRSHEKLTTGGMTFLDVDVVQVLEETLPARFGGGPSDYQLVEAEGEHGEPSVRLLVHPRLGHLDERAVADAFLDAIGPGSGVERVMALQWRGGRSVAVERRPPVTTAVGKIQHLHRERARPGAAT
jgi:hypothetical protein